MGRSLIIVDSKQKYDTLLSYIDDTMQLLNGGDWFEGAVHRFLSSAIEKPHSSDQDIKHRIQELIKSVSTSDRVFFLTSPDFYGELLWKWFLHTIVPDHPKARHISLTAFTKSAFRKALKQKGGKKVDRPSMLEMAEALNTLFQHGLQSLSTVRGIRDLDLTSAIVLLMMVQHEASQIRPADDLFIESRFRYKNNTFTARLVTMNESQVSLRNENRAKALIYDLKQHTFLLAGISDSVYQRPPEPPLNLTKLISAADTYLGFSATETLNRARFLYEGCIIGKSPVGLITYPVTDSLFIPDDEILALREYIYVQYGKEYLPGKAIQYGNSDSPSTAIRPTLPLRPPQKVKKYLEERTLKLYELIWARHLASQMRDEQYVKRSLTIISKPQKFEFQIHELQTLERGFLQVYPYVANKSSQIYKTEWRKNIKLECVEFFISKDRPIKSFEYSEGRLYQAIGETDVCLIECIPRAIKKCFDLHFIKKCGNNIVVTQLGINAATCLKQNYPDITSFPFLKQLKKRMLACKCQDDCRALVTDFEKLVSRKRELSDKSSAQTGEDPITRCPRCGGHVRTRTMGGETVKVCEHYPGSCRYKKKEDSLSEFYGYCSECNSELIVREGRYGRFLACSSFPKCTFTKPYPVGCKCPEPGCNGEVIERFTKSGRLFYGCSLYPGCKFSSWKKPVNMACPNCGNLYLVENVDSSYTCPKCKKKFKASEFA